MANVVKVGACGLIIAFFSSIFGLLDIGLWLTCYFECVDGQVIEYNYFTAIWTGALAFASGFMICVLYCVKFRFLGSFIIVVTCVLVPCEIFCACIYGYRAYESRVNTDLDVPLFVGMAVCGAILFVVTIMWNCYYCCIATPEEDYEEEVKEDIEEEENRQDAIRTMHERFTNNPIVDDSYRNGRPNTVPFAQPASNRHPDPRLIQYVGQNRYPQQLQPPRTGRNNKHQKPRDGNRHVNRPADYPRGVPIREDYPYPPAFTREHAQAQQQGRVQEDMHRAQRVNFDQSQIIATGGRGQVNRAYEPDEFNRAMDEYSTRVYMFDGLQGQPAYGQPPQTQYMGRTPPPEYYSQDPRMQPNQARVQSNQQGVSSLPVGGRQRNERTGGREAGQPRDNDRSYIYRPRPDNFRGKPPKPSYMQQERAGRSSHGNDNFVAATSQYPAFREEQPFDAYF